MRRGNGLETRLIHAERRTNSSKQFDRGTAISSPIWQTATFGFETPEEAGEAGAASRPLSFYSRYGNPSFAPVEKIVSDLEGGEAALVTGSGMGAISLVFLTFLESGDHVVGQKTHYVGTAKLLRRWLPRFGIEVTLVDQDDLGAFEKALRPNTRLIFIETPVNPTLKLTDVAAVASLARDNSITTCIDNTFATPINQRPLELGIDLVVHSCTKYLGGHSDVTAGIIVGDEERIESIWEALIVYGMVLHPFESWLLNRGLKTLPFRVDRHNRNAAAVAEFLEPHPKVARVHYPGLPSHAQHELAKQQMDGYGGLVVFEMDGGYEEARRFVGSLELARLAVSLGGAETLASHPASMVFPHLSPEERSDVGVMDSLIRLSVGLETADDIIEDLDQALGR